MRQNNEKKEINEKRIDLQTLQGKLCVALYEKAGNEGLEVIKKIYSEYGYDVGLGLKKKWHPRDLSEASKQFEKMTNDGDLPSEVEVKGNEAHWKANRCPFSLQNTYRPVCEAVMAMDREIFRALLGLDKGQVEIEIRKTVADGDEFCLGIVKLAGNV
jgi:predicted hydrocarbon binding protein